MARRLNTLKGNISFFLLFLIVGVFSHINIVLTDTVELSLYPIPLMITVYLGYKLGRWTGLVAGISISSIATLFVLFKERMQIDWIELLFDGASLSSYGLEFFGSPIEFIILAGALGWLSGFLFDCLDNVLAKEGLCIDKLIPQRRRSILLQTLQCFNKRFAFLHSNKPQDKSENDQKSTRRRLRKMLIHPAAIVLAFLNISLYLTLSEHINITIWPEYLAADQRVPTSKSNIKG